MDNLWTELQPVLQGFITSPITISTVIVIVGIILAYLKIPKWISDIIILIIKHFFNAVEDTEKVSKNIEMSSEQKLQYAIAEVQNNDKLNKAEKIILKTGLAKRIIEDAVLPVFQKFWKHKK
jgi:hypothetical protein